MDDRVFINGPGLRAEIGPLALVCVIGHWPGGADLLASHLRVALVCDLPGCGQRFVPFSGGQAFRIQRNRLRIVSRDGHRLSGRLRDGWNAEKGTLSEQSHGFLQLRLQGPMAEDVLRAGLAFDPRAGLPSPMAFACTRIGDANVQIARCAAENYEILVGRSFALALENWITRTAKSINN